MALHKYGIATVVLCLLTACGGDLTGSSNDEVDETVSEEIIVDLDEATAPVLDEVSGTATSLIFVSALPSNIAMKGVTGSGRSQTSTITFKMVDSNGVALDGHEVDFTLSKTRPGVILQVISGVTDENGLVSTIVKSGAVAGPVVVQAVSSSDPDLIQTSNQLNITTGYPDQDSFSLSVETLAPEAEDYDGTEVGVTIRLGGGEENTAVPDGTVVNFRTTGGKITDKTGSISSCETVGSVCSMVWTSQDPRTPNGRAVITAYAVGEESFTDSNRNGIYDEGEPFIDNSEPYADEDFNGMHNDDEWFDDVLGGTEGVYDLGDNKYNGFQCVEDSEFCTKSLIYVFDSIQLVMAGSSFTCVFQNGNGTTLSEVDLIANTSVKLVVLVSDQNGNTPPAGTKIAMSQSNGDADELTETSVKDSTNNFFKFDVNIKRETTDNESSSGEVKFSFTTPNGAGNSCAILVRD